MTKDESVRLWNLCFEGFSKEVQNLFIDSNYSARIPKTLYFIANQNTFDIVELKSKESSEFLSKQIFFTDQIFKWEEIITAIHSLPRIIRRNINVKKVHWFDYERIYEAIIKAKYILKVYGIDSTISRKFFSSKNNIFDWGNIPEIWIYTPFKEIVKEYPFKYWYENDLLYVVAKTPREASILGLGTSLCFSYAEGYFHEYKNKDGVIIFYENGEGEKFAKTEGGYYDSNGTFYPD